MLKLNQSGLKTYTLCLTSANFASSLLAKCSECKVPYTHFLVNIHYVAVMKEERSKWSRWKDQHYVPLTRAISGFGYAELTAKGIRVELSKDTPKLRRKTIETMAGEAGSCITSQSQNLPRDIIFVRMP